MTPPRRILIVAGEPSGDLHASNLVKELKALGPDLEFFGLGGNLLEGAGAEIVFDISDLALIGVIEVARNIAVVKKAYDMLIKKIDSAKPDLAILVDYPGFNLKLAKALKKRSIPVVYYRSPRMWAWGMERIKIIKETVKKIVVFFKFEEALYKRYGIDVECVGHPLLDTVRVTSSKDETIKRYGLSKDKFTVALLPGSRAIEVERLLPVMLGAADGMLEKMKRPVQFIIAKFKGLPLDLYEDSLNRPGLDIRLADGDAYNVLAASDFAIVASGTATLETAIIGTPFLIVYKGNLLSYLLYKMVARIPFLGLVNVIAKSELVPELIQFDATPEKIAARAVALMSDKAALKAMADELKKTSGFLGAPGASRRAAQAILPLL